MTHMEQFFEKFEREVEQDLDNLAHEIGLWLMGGKGAILKREFDKQKIELPPPDILKKMMEVDYPNWKKICRAFAIIFGPVPKPTGPFFRPIYSLIPLSKVMSDVLDELQLDPTDAEKRSHIRLKLFEN